MHLKKREPTSALQTVVPTYGCKSNVIGSVKKNIITSSVSVSIKYFIQKKKKNPKKSILSKRDLKFESRLQRKLTGVLT